MSTNKKKRKRIGEFMDVLKEKIVNKNVKTHISCVLCKDEEKQIFQNKVKLSEIKKTLCGKT